MELNEISGQIVEAAITVRTVLGLLIHFNVVHLKNGIKRMANSL